MTNKLKPCPFCGGEATFDTIAPNEHSVYCLNCRVESNSFEFKDKAIASWNSRAEGWQSIRTAPKDGTSILVYSPKYKEKFVVQWMINIDDAGDSHWVIDSLDNQVLIIRDASHWMNLPQPPTEGK